MTPSPALFQSVPEKDYFSFLPKGKPPEFQEIVNFFNFKGHDVAKAADVSEKSVRYDEKMPVELQERLREWAILVNLVAEFFKGDLERTVQWFKMPNPLLGYISPRDMIRVGRFKKLLKFIISAIDENRR
ncbi:MAG: hypothetical protein WC969_08015 [Elusimicrobiota bacterium]|jgi:hypothetical protein